MALGVVTVVTFGSAFFATSTVFLTVAVALTLLAALADLVVAVFGAALVGTLFLLGAFPLALVVVLTAAVDFFVGCSVALALCFTLKLVTAFLTTAVDFFATGFVAGLVAGLAAAFGKAGFATARVAVFAGATATVFFAEDLGFRLAAFFSVALDFAKILLALESTGGFAGFFML
ncbi:hypothetical protein [Sapientia aquatica]|uniref:Uncharacterized protein n=1 Tax=Sapientia aquatica TaxID=1549640 RepID=A0A4R5W1R4_9BURK|nr:hypothetical protein [Sapientia aquatica]TDK66361.1 hypothetical protein E2I14_07755 [Sapientia aquatica]